MMGKTQHKMTVVLAGTGESHVGTEGERQGASYCILREKTPNGLKRVSEMMPHALRFGTPYPASSCTTPMYVSKASIMTLSFSTLPHLYTTHNPPGVVHHTAFCNAVL